MNVPCCGAMPTASMGMSQLLAEPMRYIPGRRTNGSTVCPCCNGSRTRIEADCFWVVSCDEVGMVFGIVVTQKWITENRGLLVW